jgi:Uma2 family endonuclease
MDSQRVIELDYDDYAAIPPDGQRWELLEGKLEVNPAPNTRHQTVSRRLQHELMLALEDRGLAQVFDAPVDLILARTTVLQPDLLIVSLARASIISRRGIEGPPDVAIEILSPSSRSWDRRGKSVGYAKFGVPEYWIVDPEDNWIDLFRLTEGAYALERRFERTDRLVTPSFVEVDIDLGRVFRD